MPLLPAAALPLVELLPATKPGDGLGGLLLELPATAARIASAAMAGRVVLAAAVGRVMLAAAVGLVALVAGKSPSPAEGLLGDGPGELIMLLPLSPASPVRSAGDA